MSQKWNNRLSRGDHADYDLVPPTALQTDPQTVCHTKQVLTDHVVIRTEIWVDEDDELVEKTLLIKTQEYIAEVDPES